jgi:type IV secretory pathway component VirB8
MIWFDSDHLIKSNQIIWHTACFDLANSIVVVIKIIILFVLSALKGVNHVLRV